MSASSTLRIDNTASNQIHKIQSIRPHCLGQAQEERGGSDRNADVQHRNTGDPPFAIPVEIIEDEAKAEAAERLEEVAAQREIEDLIAQQGMNAATQQMNDATQAMATYSLWQTWLVGIGTVLLVVTLHLTLKANNAARQALQVTREIGVAQTRAYVGIPHVEATVQGAVVTDQSISVTVTIGNSGQSPAINTRFDVKLVCPCVFPDPNIVRRLLRLGRDITAGERGVEILKVDRSPVPEGIRGLLPGDPPIFRVEGEIEYETVFRREGTTVLKFSIDLLYPPDKETGALEIRPRIAFNQQEGSKP